MPHKQSIQIFEEKQVRTAWDADAEKWYFAIPDVVKVLTDSVNPTDYIKKMKKRDEELAKGWGQIVTPLSMQTPGGPQRVNCADTQGIFRIIQSIPSPKAEPFKQWMHMWQAFASIRCKTQSSPLIRQSKTSADSDTMRNGSRHVFAASKCATSSQTSGSEQA